MPNSMRGKLRPVPICRSMPKSEGGSTNRPPSDPPLKPGLRNQTASERDGEHERHDRHEQAA